MNKQLPYTHKVIQNDRMQYNILSLFVFQQGSLVV